MKKFKFYAEPRGFLTQTAAILMVIAAVLRLIGGWGAWEDRVFLYVGTVLPVCCALLFAALLLTLGRAAFWASFLPVALGAVCFIAEAVAYASWARAMVSILLALLAAAVYFATAFGRIRTKLAGAALYALLIAYVLFVRDRELIASLSTAPAQTVLRELALLCALTALLCTALALRRIKLSDPLAADLPKIADPVVIPPARADEVPAASADAAPAPAEAPAADTSNAQNTGEKT